MLRGAASSTVLVGRIRVGLEHESELRLRGFLNADVLDGLDHSLKLGSGAPAGQRRRHMWLQEARPFTGRFLDRQVKQEISHL